MEKLTVEIELSKEELEMFDEIIERWCVDPKKWIKKLILESMERIETDCKRAARN